MIIKKSNEFSCTKLQDYLDKLDYSITATKDRIDFINELFKEPNLFNELFSESKGSSLMAKKASQTLDIIADYMMAGQRDFPTISKMNKPNKREVSLNGLITYESGVNEDNQFSTETSVNYYINTQQVITASDLKDPELSTILGDYQRYKVSLQKTRDKAKLEKNGKLKYKCDKIIGEVNHDMIEVKNAIKQPIQFKHATNVTSPTNWLECDYTDYEQVKALVVLNPRKLNTDLGVLTYDISKILEMAKLSKTEKKIISFIRKNDNLTQQEIADALNYTQPYINMTIKCIVKKIQKLNIH